MIEKAKSESTAGEFDRVIAVSGAAVKSPDHPMSQSPDDPITQSPDSSRSREDGKPLASSTVEDLEGPWILLKVKALGELIPAAGKSLEEKLDATHMPNEISAYLRHEYGILLSELEVSRYGAWLPHIRRDALKKAEEQAERNVQEAKQRMKRRRK
jgi:hypothetical protein